MNFTDYMWLKLIVLCVIAFCLGAYAEFKGMSVEEVLRGRRGRADRLSAQEPEEARKHQDD